MVIENWLLVFLEIWLRVNVPGWLKMNFWQYKGSKGEGCNVKFLFSFHDRREVYEFFCVEVEVFKSLTSTEKMYSFFLYLFIFIYLLFCFLFIYSFFNFNFYFIFLYSTVLVLPYTDMNPPWVSMSSQSWTPLPPLSPYHLSGHPSAPAPSILYRT